MSKVKYYYDAKTLSYVKIEKSFGNRFRSIGLFLASTALFALLIMMVSFNYFDSPKEKRLHRELENMVLQYEIMNEKIEQISSVLDDVQERDDNIYRVIFEAEPIPKSIRKAGFGGVNRYKKLEGFDHSNIVIESTQKLDQIAKQLYVQSKSFDEVIEMVKNKEAMLAAIPAIQPVSNKDLTRMASGYGFRIDPHYKTRKMHYGMDFTAPRGTPIYATGDGIILRADSKSSGFGKHVRIDHGYGYVTLYAHMSAYNVRKGQKVKRGDVIGYVGNTGKSKGPHCHYEVHKDGVRINPVNFYFDDLTPEEYDKMITASSQENQSLD